VAAADPVTTDGWRGLPGPDWSEPAILGTLAGLVRDGRLGGRAAVAFDGRAGSRDLAVLACDLLAANGIACLLADEPAPTPALGRFVRDSSEVDSGLTFTASHNPPGYVGFKLRDADGLSSNTPAPEPLPAPLPTPCRHAAASITACYAQTAGQDLLGALAGFDGDAAFDCAHGAVGALARHLPGITWARSRSLPYFGGVTPDPAEYANIDAAWRSLQAAAPDPSRLLGAFTDGDGDRLVLATSGSGWISSTEQAAIACTAGLPATAVIASVVTPLLARRAAEAAGMAWTEAPVGFKHIVAAWRHQCMPPAIGLEPNGALAYAPGPGGYFERDAVSTLALITRALPSVREIDGAVTALRARYPASPQIITSPLEVGDVLARLERALPGWDQSSGGGLASFTSGDHRYLVRPSGTEAATRVYAEALPSSVREVRAALSQDPHPGGGSGT
jgi:phosphomannomutase